MCEDRNETFIRHIQYPTQLHIATHIATCIAITGLQGLGH